MPNMLTAWTVLKDLCWAINEHFQTWDCSKFRTRAFDSPQQLIDVYTYLSYIHLFYIHESSIYTCIYSFLFLYRLYFAYRTFVFIGKPISPVCLWLTVHHSVHLKAWAPAPSTQKSAGPRGATTSWTHATGASGIQGEELDGSRAGTWWCVREVDFEVS